MARILVIDDDPDFLESSSIILEAEGHEVQTAFSAEEGIAAVTETPPELVFADMMMGENDAGLQVAKAARAGGYEGPIVLMSGVSHLQAADLETDDGTRLIAACLEKPVSPGELLATTEKLLDS